MWLFKRIYLAAMFCYIFIFGLQSTFYGRQTMYRLSLIVKMIMISSLVRDSYRFNTQGSFNTAVILAIFHSLMSKSSWNNKSQRNIHMYINYYVLEI